MADQDADAVGRRWGDTGTAAGVRLNHGERGGPVTATASTAQPSTARTARTTIKITYSIRLIVSQTPPDGAAIGPAGGRAPEGVVTGRTRRDQRGARAQQNHRESD